MLTNIKSKLQTGIETAAVSGNRMISNLRGVEETIDANFESQRKFFDAYMNYVPQLLESLKKHMNIIAGLGDSFKSLSVSVSRVSGEEQRVLGSEDLVQSSEGLLLAAQYLVKSAQPLELALKQLIEKLNGTKKNIIDRDRLLIDNDSARHALANETKKATPNPAHIEAAQKKVEDAKNNFDRKNCATMAEISEIQTSRFLGSEVQTLIANMASFYQNAATSFATIANKMAQLQSSTPPIPPPVPVPVYTGPPAPIVPEKTAGNTPTPHPTPSAVNPSTTPSPSGAPPSSGAHPPAVPPPIPAPRSVGDGNGEKVQAMFAFKPEAPTELEFVPGDVINVSKRDHPDWWIGELNGKTGEFPSSYVKPLNFSV